MRPSQHRLLADALALPRAARSLVARTRSLCGSTSHPDLRLALLVLQVLDAELPVMEPYFIQNPDLSESGPGLRVTWLGHATVLVEIDGLNVLTDPIFSQRASPVQFMGPRRYRGPPCTVEQVERLSALPATFSRPRVFYNCLPSPALCDPANSCQGSTPWLSVTPITTTWTSAQSPASTRALEGHCAGR